MQELIIGYVAGCVSVGAIWFFRAQIKAEYEKDLAAIHGKLDQVVDKLRK